MYEHEFTEAEYLLKELISALDNAFISSWQSTHAHMHTCMAISVRIRTRIFL